MRNQYPLIGALALLVTGCAHGRGGNHALLDRAVHDLQCPRDSISVLEGGKQRDVEGCGRRATYGWSGRSWVPADQLPTTYGQSGPTIVYPGQGAPRPLQETQYVQAQGTQYVPPPQSVAGGSYATYPGPTYGQAPASGQVQTLPYGPAQPSSYGQPQPVPYGVAVSAYALPPPPAGWGQAQPR
jgi:hypothetical protein